MSKEILSVSDLAETLGISAEEVSVLFESGELPGRKIGKHWFCTRQQLLQYIETGDQTKSKASTGTPKGLEGKHKADNSWECETCKRLNGPEDVVCSACGKARLGPLINYIPFPKSM